MINHLIKGKILTTIGNLNSNLDNKGITNLDPCFNSKIKNFEYHASENFLEETLYIKLL